MWENSTVRQKLVARQFFLYFRGSGIKVIIFGRVAIPISGKKKQHKHKLFGPDFPRTFLTLTPGCPGVKKFLPTTGAAGKNTFWCGRPRFSARTSMTRRVVEKLCTKKVRVDFLARKCICDATVLISGHTSRGHLEALSADWPRALGNPLQLWRNRSFRAALVRVRMIPVFDSDSSSGDRGVSLCF